MSIARPSLVAQELGIHLPMEGTWDQSLVWEDSTHRRTTKPMYRNYQACMLQLLKPACLERVLHNKRSHGNERPKPCNEM